MSEVGFKLESDPGGIAKRRAILQDCGNGHWVPVAWVDYDDVPRHEADVTAQRILTGLSQVLPDPPEGFEWETGGWMGPTPQAPWPHLNFHVDIQKLPPTMKPVGIALLNLMEYVSITAHEDYDGETAASLLERAIQELDELPEARPRCAHPGDCDEIGGVCDYTDCPFGPRPRETRWFQVVADHSGRFTVRAKAPHETAIRGATKDYDTVAEANAWLDGWEDRDTEDGPKEEPEEGTPTTILADAVNQLAMEIEAPLLSVVSPSIRPDLLRRLRKIRENVAPLIPE